MAKELTDYRTLDELNIQETSHDVIMNKPTVIVSVSLLIGVGCMLLPHIMAKILGILFLVPSIYILFFVKDEKCMEFYDDYLLVYKTKEKAMKLRYSYISEYAVKRSHYGTQAILLTMNTNDYVYVETFQLRSVRNVLNKYLKNKELRKDS